MPKQNLPVCSVHPWSGCLYRSYYQSLCTPNSANSQQLFFMKCADNMIWSPFTFPLLTLTEAHEFKLAKRDQDLKMMVAGNKAALRARKNNLPASGPLTVSAAVAPTSGQVQVSEASTSGGASGPTHQAGVATGAARCSERPGKSAAKVLDNISQAAAKVVEKSRKKGEWVGRT